MNRKRFLPMLTAFYLLAALFCTPALAVGSVADAVEQTWGDASEQIKAVVDSVVFPALSMVLAIAFFVKLALTYFEYRKHGQCGATSFLRNSDKIYEKKRNASQAPGRRFWPSAAARGPRTRTRSWRPLWTRWRPPGSLIVRSVGWRWTTRPTPCDCYCSRWGGM